SAAAGTVVAVGVVQAARVGVAVAWQALLGVVVVVTGGGQLMEVVAARCAAGGLAHLLDSRDKQGDQDGDDRDNDEQLDEREAAPEQTRRAHGTPPRATSRRGMIISLHKPPGSICQRNFAVWAQIAHRAGVSEALAARFGRRDCPPGSRELPTESNQTERKPGRRGGRRGRAPRSRRVPVPMSFAPRRRCPGGG